MNTEQDIKTYYLWSLNFSNIMHIFSIPGLYQREGWVISIQNSNENLETSTQFCHLPGFYRES